MALPTVRAEEEAPVKFTWYGHAAFLVETGGLRIILDPFSPTSGYDPIDEPADILAMSQDDDRFHSHAESVLGDPTVLIGKHMGAEPTVVKGIPFRAIPVWEDAHRTKNKHAMIAFEAEGLRVTHMGDLGHMLNEEELATIAGTDVLLALAGGRHTVALDDLAAIIGAAKPPLVIPMHYQTGKVLLDIQTLDAFLAHYPADMVERRDSISLEVSRATLPASTRIVVLKHAR
jgi:L-ascorbate metabolism protein UlaG (beta-lactamase superfamily)